MQTVTKFVNVTVVLSIWYWSKKGREPKKPQDIKDLYIKEDGESYML